jgi:hypothetical protein
LRSIEVDVRSIGIVRADCPALATNARIGTYVELFEKFVDPSFAHGDAGHDAEAQASLHPVFGMWRIDRIHNEQGNAASDDRR